MPEKHNPNPFYFVPFREQGPSLYTPDELETTAQDKPEPLISGYLELRLKAITPVHIVGSMTRETYKEGHSTFYRQDDHPCIPASTIRGCLRAFIEALTNGWVSQTNEEYEAAHGKRHIGFKAYDTERTTSYGRYPGPAFTAIRNAYAPWSETGGKIDIASYLFGTVVEPEDGEDEEAVTVTRKGKVFIEDALPEEASLVKRTYWVPDLGPADHDSFFGGAHPSASNWWYMTPGRIHGSHIHGNHMAELEGRRFRGRKFYYHQDPATCVEEYRPEKWVYDSSFYTVWLQSMAPKKLSRPFRIYFDGLPKKLLRLLVLALLLGDNIRHKLGYGKAFGYGSIEFLLTNVRARISDNSPGLPQRLGACSHLDKWRAKGWYAGPDRPIEYVDKEALENLARILSIHRMSEITYTYPPYRAIEDRNNRRRGRRNPRVFERPVYYNETTNAGVSHSRCSKADASKLWGIKRTIDLELYQEKSNAWDIIKNRTP